MMKKHIAEPIKNKKDIKAVEQYLKEHNERDYVIWVLGLNSGLRISDIVGLNVSDVVEKTHITIIEKKTQIVKNASWFNINILEEKNNILVSLDNDIETINFKLKKVLKSFTKGRNLDEPLFLGKQGKRLDRKQVYRFLIDACNKVGVKSKVSTHTMRRTFGYHHYQQYKDAVILQKIFNHSSQRITLMYIGIEQDEIDYSYKNFEL